MVDGERLASTRAENAHTWQESGLKNGKLGQPDPAAQPPKCPECSSQRVWKDGHRHNPSNGVTIQRWLCRECGFRFSEQSWSTSESLEQVPTVHTKPFYSDNASPSSCQVCELAEDPKNLDPATEIKTVAGEGLPQTQQGLIVEFQWKMKKRGLSELTIDNRTKHLKHLTKLGADLQNPDSVEIVLATEYSKASVKHEAVKGYAAFCKAFKISWDPIKVNYEPKTVFLPTEEEIDLLIATCGKITSTFLQVLKDTGARAGEIRHLQWVDVDQKNNTIDINKPLKGSNSRTIKVSDRTVAMINRLPRKHGDYVFNPKGVGVQTSFMKTRKKLADRLGNPRLLKIHFHTLRHWKATMTYAKTREIYEVKRYWATSR